MSTPLRGHNPERRSYRSYASFSDPDGNGWLPQEVTERLSGRVDAHVTTFTSAAIMMRIGRTGTPTISYRSRPAGRCRDSHPSMKPPGMHSAKSRRLREEIGFCNGLNVINTRFSDKGGAQCTKSAMWFFQASSSWVLQR
jgi:hypothetical protein